jgi:hypothetical protein
VSSLNIPILLPLVVLYIGTQYVGECCQIIAWNRHKLDSSGKLVGWA